jgi:hypothetical protein
MISHDLAIVDWTTQNLPMDLLQFHDIGVHLSLTGTVGAILVVALGAWVSKDAKPAAETAGEEATNKSE